MGKVITMTQTVGDLTSGQTYFVRSREAEVLKANSNCTYVEKKGANQGVLPAKTGKKGN